MSRVFVGDVGTVIILDTKVNITTTTTRKILVETPSGVSREWVASIEGLTSIKYTIQEGDLDEAGVWMLQAYVEMPGWKGRGSSVMLDVSQ